MSEIRWLKCSSKPGKYTQPYNNFNRQPLPNDMPEQEGEEDYGDEEDAQIFNQTNVPQNG